MMVGSTRPTAAKHPKEAQDARLFSLLPLDVNAGARMPGTSDPWARPNGAGEFVL